MSPSDGTVVYHNRTNSGRWIMPEWWEMYLEEDEYDWDEFDIDCYLKRRYPLI